MGRRTNPISTRVGRFLNWPSNVHYPAITQYVKHIFQHSLVGEPHIRSSTNAIWINVTLMRDKQDPMQHPRVLENTLKFQPSLDTRGQLESNVYRLTKYDQYYKKLFEHHPKSLLELKTMDKEIKIKANIIDNPLLDAQVMAHWAAQKLKTDSLSMVYRQTLKML
ncbi:hypothetical protein EDD86DRAFT_208464 [Gorgonomyces haynaldii]|nr:hypothetical protein EDD86DRAFT_208464 [Gorgonomyces haynaldii]